MSERTVRITLGPTMRPGDTIEVNLPEPAPAPVQPPPQAESVATAIRAWRVACVLRGDTQHIARRRANILMRLCGVQHWDRLADITAEGLECWLTRLEQSRENGVDTEDDGGGLSVASLVAMVRTFLGWCVAQRLVETNVGDALPGGKMMMRRGLMHDQDPGATARRRPARAKSAGPAEGSEIAQDIAAWRVELRRQGLSRDYIRRGPNLIAAVAGRFGWTSARDATAEQLVEWLSELGGSSTTANNQKSFLFSFFEFEAEILGRIEKNPARNIKRTRASIGQGSRAFSADEVRRLYNASQGNWRIAVGLMATLGLRRSAVFRGVRVGWVDLERGVLDVPRGFLKSRREQIFPLNPDARHILALATRGRLPEEHVVPVCFDRTQWARLLREAGVPAIDSKGRRAGCHSFRKYFVTSLARAGVHLSVAQRLAGHLDVGQTTRIYTQLGDEAERAAVDTLPRLR